MESRATFMVDVMTAQREGVVPRWRSPVGPFRACVRHPSQVERVRGKRILDFGCGHGWQAVALKKLGAAEVWGVDIVPSHLAFARDWPGNKVRMFISWTGYRKV